VELVSMGIENH